jgi:hypothetical protein
MCLIFVNGGGTKLLQSYFDTHPEMYNIPGYPMVYFYPHWKTWEKALENNWTWDSIIDIFCERHASVIDSRRIAGLNGLDRLGDKQQDHIEIDEETFRLHLKHILEFEPISRSTFLLAVNYAYALCKGEEISCKKVLLWHHHVFEHLEDFVSDFPDAIIYGMIRDPREKFFRVCNQNRKTDKIKLNESDAMIYRSNVFYYENINYFVTPHKLNDFVNLDNTYFIKHEDLASNLKRVIGNICKMLDIQFLDLLLESTFDGKTWWGHDIYELPKVVGDHGRALEKKDAKLISEKALTQVLSKDWKNKRSPLDIFIFEGLWYDFFMKYGYELAYYREDSLWNRILLSLAILCPFSIEKEDLLFYLNPRSHLNFLMTAYYEAVGKYQLKDYTWNATYRYKITYASLKLWRKRLSLKFLELSNKYFDRRNSKFSGRAIIFWARLFYIADQYLRYWKSIVMLPIKYLRRICFYYGSFRRRVSNRSFLAKLLAVH